MEISRGSIKYPVPREVRMLSVDQFYKTKMCPYMNKPEGCIRSKRSQCPYAHCEAELRARPNLIKTTMCKMHMRNCCPKKTEECKYAHEFSELRHTDSVYKTFVCKFWLRGYCRVGAYCRFAHGSTDIRPSSTEFLNSLDSTSTMDSLSDNPNEFLRIASQQVIESGGLKKTIKRGYSGNSGLYLNGTGDSPSLDTLIEKEDDDSFCLMHYHLQKYVDACTNTFKMNYYFKSLGDGLGC
ncbi:bifunctional Zinc finger [Babesia duncani]|uniref:Bifunctional Zinc finger n=1 Tax=Babesia duncani TaxID=323732 RepID=A0AAD9PLY8_9APIC|nr:bifunctional Zinc finger [Babesia duncani]